MKKILLCMLIIAGATELKAQQSTLTPADSLLFKSQKNGQLDQFKLGDSNLFKNLQPLDKAGQLALIQGMKGNEIIREPFYSRMPVVKPGNVDRMPVAKLGTDPNMHYTMLIKKVKAVDPLAVPQAPAPKVSW
jgi:hypothetical protein